MSNRIDEVMQINDNGYIEEYDDIEVITVSQFPTTQERLDSTITT